VAEAGALGMQTTHATRQRQLPFFLRFLRICIFSAAAPAAGNRDSRHGKCFQFSNEHDSVECMAIKMRLVACGSNGNIGLGVGKSRGKYDSGRFGPQQPR